LDNEENILNATDAIVRKVVDVNPRLIKSLIRIESNFNPSAVSDKGATGLLQIMPGTADGIAKATGLDRDKILTDPATNIEAGTWLFYEDIMPRYAGVQDGDQMKFSLAEWNSSPKTIKAARAKAKDPNNFDDVFEFLPEETQGFLGKVAEAIKGSFEVGKPTTEIDPTRPAIPDYATSSSYMQGLQRTHPEAYARLSDAQKAQFGATGSFEDTTPLPSKLPSGLEKLPGRLEKLSLGQLKKYTKDHAGNLSLEDRKTLRNLLKKKGAGKKFIRDVFGFGN